LSIGAEQKKSLFGIDGKYMANTESIGLEQEKECQPSSENWFTGCSCEVSNSNCERFKQGGGRLNPNWVEWLMVWSIEGTSLKLLEMNKFQSWLKAHLNF